MYMPIKFIQNYSMFPLLGKNNLLSNYVLDSIAGTSDLVITEKRCIQLGYKGKRFREGEVDNTGNTKNKLE